MNRNLIRPAFSNRKNAILFIFINIFFLILPYLIHYLIPYNPKKTFSSVSLNMACFPFIGDELTKTEPLDILILGSSSEWTSLNPIIIENKLKKELNRDINVINLSTNWYASEARYFMLEEILKNRKISLVIFGQNDVGSDIRPHLSLLTTFLYPRHQEQLQLLPINEKIILYSISVYGSLKHIINYDFKELLNPNPVRDCSDNFIQNYKGYYAGNHGFHSYIDKNIKYSNKEIEFKNNDINLNDMFFKGKNDDFFEIIESKYSSYNSFFISQMNKLCKSYNTKFMMIRIPVNINDLTSKNKLREKVKVMEFSDDKNFDFPFVGIPQTLLYKNLSNEQIFSLHSNENHHSEYGANYFSTAIVPAIKKILVSN